MNHDDELRRLIVRWETEADELERANDPHCAQLLRMTSKDLLVILNRAP